jgi:hypothetical protein
MGRRLLTPTLPASQTRAIWVLALFAAIQLLDAALTAAGVARFGRPIEANPLLSFYAETLGVGVTVTIAKLVSVACGTVLHLHARYLALAVLTLGYVVAAVLPWTWVLAH